MARRFIRQRLGKVGLPPGALVRVLDSEHPPENPTILAIEYLEEHIDEKALDAIDEMGPLLEAAHPTWIDISGSHPISTYQKLGKMLDLHPLTLEDMLNTDQRPKTEEFDNYVFIVLKKPVFSPTEDRLELDQVSIILTNRVVVSLHERVPSPVSPIRSRMVHEQSRIRRLGTDYLAYVIVDSIVDEYFVAMEQFEDRVTDVEKELAAEPTTATMQKISRLKQEVILLRKSVWPLREVIARMSKTDSPLFDEGIKLYLKDLQDHIVQIIDLIDIYRDMLSSMLDIYLSTMSHRTNQIMKTLTLIASIFIPLTLVTGIYGMNFTDMPEIHWKYGYLFSLGIMALIATTMLLYFRRRGWI